MTTQCPKSLVSAQSLAFLELYRAWKTLGSGDALAIEAKSAEAIQLLEQEWTAENQNAK